MVFFFFFGGGGGGWGAWWGGGGVPMGGCEPRIEVIVKMLKKWGSGRGGGGGGWEGGGWELILCISSLPACMKRI